MQTGLYMTIDERQRKEAHLEYCLQRAAEFELDGNLPAAERALSMAMRVESELKFAASKTG